MAKVTTLVDRVASATTSLGKSVAKEVGQGAIDLVAAPISKPAREVASPALDKIVDALGQALKSGERGNREIKESIDEQSELESAANEEVVAKVERVSKDIAQIDKSVLAMKASNDDKADITHDLLKKGFQIDEYAHLKEKRQGEEGKDEKEPSWLSKLLGGLGLGGLAGGALGLAKRGSGALLGAVGGALARTRLGRAAKGVFKKIGRRLGKKAAGRGATLGASALAGPAAPIVAGVAALGFAGYDLYQGYDGEKAKSRFGDDSASSKAKSAAAELVSGLTLGLLSPENMIELGQMFVEKLGINVEPFFKFIGDSVESLRPYFEPAMKAVQDTLQVVVTGFLMLKDWWGVQWDIMSTMFEEGKKLFTTGVEKVQEITQWLGKTYDDARSMLMDNVINPLKEQFDKVRPILEKIIEPLIKAYEWIAKKLEVITGPIGDAVDQVKSWAGRVVEKVTEPVSNYVKSRYDQAGEIVKSDDKDKKPYERETSLYDVATGRGAEGSAPAAAPKSGGSRERGGGGGHRGARTTSKEQQALMQGTYKAFRAQGLSHEGALAMVGEIGRENAYQSKHVFGKHVDPHNGAMNMGFISWQGDRAKKLNAYMAEQGLLNKDGSIMQGQKALDAQAAFLVREMETGNAKNKDTLKYLRSENVDANVAMDRVGRDFIKWRIDDPKYRESGLRNRSHFYAAGAAAVGDGRNLDGLYDANQQRLPEGPMGSDIGMNGPMMAQTGSMMENLGGMMGDGVKGMAAQARKWQDNMMMHLAQQVADETPSEVAPTPKSTVELPGTGSPAIQTETIELPKLEPAAATAAASPTESVSTGSFTRLDDIQMFPQDQGLALINTGTV